MRDAVVNQVKTILFVHNSLTEFVRLDLEELRRRYEVTEHYQQTRWVNPIALWRLVRKHDLVFGWFASWHTFLPLLLASLAHKPSVLVVGGYDVANMPEIGYGHQRGGFRKWVSRCTMRLATRLITNSNYSLEEVVRNANVPREKVCVSYHGVPDRLGSLPPGPRKRLALTVGNVDRDNLQRKGLEPFVRAAALLPDVDFALVGDWKDQAIDQLRTIATPNVSFAGRVSSEALLDYYASAAVYVQASRHEGFGMSVAEAMLAGCVPVTTNAGALAEVTGGCGVRLSSAEPAEVARGIVAALALPDEERKGIRARILELFPLSKRGRELEQLIEPFLDRRAAAQTRETPFVSIIMPVRNEANFIRRSLQAVLDQDYPRERMEIIVADGRSSDGTRNIVEEIRREHSSLHLIDNPGEIVSFGLNAALRIAKGEIVVRVDGHCEIASDFVSRCVQHLIEDEVDCVGGPIETIGETYSARAIAAAMSSTFGVGGSAFRVAKNSQRLVDTVPFPAFRRDTIESAGPFDEELVRNQDDEYSYRLRKFGQKILLAPDIRSRYYSRAGLGQLGRQYFQYGYWKVRVLQKHSRQMSARQFVPPLFVVMLLLLLLSAPFFSWAQTLFATVVAVYLVVSLAASLIAARSDWRLLPLLPPAFMIMHLAYGAGFLLGMLKFWKRWGDRTPAPTARNAIAWGNAPGPEH
jgi:succinoglycan biosynthesis protein ExoA